MSTCVPVRVLFSVCTYRCDSVIVHMKNVDGAETPDSSSLGPESPKGGRPC